MFDNLEDVARHLQNLGAKLDVPNDPQMADVLGRFGVLKKSNGEFLYILVIWDTRIMGILKLFYVKNVF